MIFDIYIVTTVTHDMFIIYGHKYTIWTLELKYLICRLEKCNADSTGTSTPSEKTRRYKGLIGALFNQSLGLNKTKHALSCSLFNRL